MIITTSEFDYKWFKRIRFQKRKSGNKGTKTKAWYKDIVTAFDIETTRLEDIDQSFMYIWQWQFGLDVTVVGRTWEELSEFIENLNACMRGDDFLVVYVHNLSYEFQFLRAIHEWQSDEVFAVKSRKVLKAKWNHLEYRCSYIHSNMGLGTYLKKMGAKHQKLDGKEFDYTKKRYPWTPLSDRELEYCVNDVRGLVEALINEMAVDGDNLYTIPLTSTGYVRRDVRRSMEACDRHFIQDLLPEIDLYHLLHRAMRGGNTHASRFFSGIIVEGVDSGDRSSSYPDTQCNCEFPISKFRKEFDTSIDNLEKQMFTRHRACLFSVTFTNIRLADSFWPCPYISYSKCDIAIGESLDNGRILSASKIRTALTDIDFLIILDEYVWDEMIIDELYTSRYGNLPKELTSVVIHYYVEKTRLKGVESQKVYYEKQKNKLNGIYGMTAQDPVKQNIVFDGTRKEQFYVDTQNEEDILERSNKRAFMPYQWGVWTTAWARYRLEEGIRLAGHNFVYCDTDSVKYVGKIDWTEYNEKRKNDSLASGAYAQDPAGVMHYMGVYEDDGHYEKFKTLGAKKYVVVENGKLKVTIAGVGKDEGGKELLRKGGIASFDTGFIFKDAGGTESVYNDKSYGEYYTEDGNKIFITPNICIRDSTYKVGMTDDYAALLDRIKKGTGITNNYYS